MGSFGGDGDDNEEEGGEEGGDGDDFEDEEEVAGNQAQAENKSLTELYDPRKIDLRERSANSLSELEKLQYLSKLYKLKHERIQNFKQMRRAVASFDEGIAALIAERFKVQADLKTTDLRMLVLEQELQLLREFDKKDSQLVARQQKKMKEKAEIERQLAG